MAFLPPIPIILASQGPRSPEGASDDEVPLIDYIVMNSQHFTPMVVDRTKTLRHKKQLVLSFVDDLLSGVDAPPSPPNSPTSKPTSPQSECTDLTPPRPIYWFERPLPPSLARTPAARLTMTATLMLALASQPPLRFFTARHIAVAVKKLYKPDGPKPLRLAEEVLHTFQRIEMCDHPTDEVLMERIMLQHVLGYQEGVRAEKEVAKYRVLKGEDLVAEEGRVYRRGMEEMRAVERKLLPALKSCLKKRGVGELITAPPSSPDDRPDTHGSPPVVIDGVSNNLSTPSPSRTASKRAVHWPTLDPVTSRYGSPAYTPDLSDGSGFYIPLLSLPGIPLTTAQRLTLNVPRKYRHIMPIRELSSDELSSSTEAIGFRGEQTSYSPEEVHEEMEWRRTSKVESKADQMVKKKWASSKRAWREARQRCVGWRVVNVERGTRDADEGLGGRMGGKNGGGRDGRKEIKKDPFEGEGEMRPRLMDFDMDKAKMDRPKIRQISWNPFQREAKRRPRLADFQLKIFKRPRAKSEAINIDPNAIADVSALKTQGFDPFKGETEMQPGLPDYAPKIKLAGPFQEERDMGPGLTKFQLDTSEIKSKKTEMRPRPMQTDFPDLMVLHDVPEPTTVSDPSKGKQEMRPGLMEFSVDLMVMKGKDAFKLEAEIELR